MTVENVTYIDDLDPSYPDGTDSMSEGDDHIRNIKKSIKATFPKVSGEVPLVVKGDGVTGFESSTEFGAGPDSNHNFVGDVFVGYDSPIAQPDEQNGTLLCARGILVGRGGSVGDASIGMEGNVIWNCGDVVLTGMKATEPSWPTNEQSVKEALIEAARDLVELQGTVNPDGNIYMNGGTVSGVDDVVLTNMPSPWPSSTLSLVDALTSSAQNEYSLDLRVKALENAFRSSNSFDEFKTAMLAALEEMQKES